MRKVADIGIEVRLWALERAATVATSRDGVVPGATAIMNFMAERGFGQDLSMRMVDLACRRRHY